MSELRSLKDSIATSNELTREEQELNIQKIDLFLTGSQDNNWKSLMSIESGKPSIDVTV